MGKVTTMIKTFFGSLIWLGIVNLILYRQIRGPVDPKIDDTEPFSYYVKPIYELGVRNFEHASALTYESTLFTATGEFYFLIGQQLKQFKKRIWIQSEDFLPSYEAKDEVDGVEYHFKIFHFWTKLNFTTNYLIVKIKNNDNRTKKASFAIGYAYILSKDHRPRIIREKKGKISHKDNLLLKDNRIILYADEMPKTVLSEKNRTLLKYEYDLKPRETKVLCFKIPHFSIPATEDALKALALGCDEAYKQFSNYWKKKISDGVEIYVPEKKVNNMYRSSLIYLMIAQKRIGDEVIQHVNRFQYNKFWIRDSAFISKMFLNYGYPDIAKGIIKHMLRYQRENGLFESQHGQYDGWGQVLWSIGEYIKVTRDIEFAEKIYPRVIKALRWFVHAIKNDPYHLIPITHALDNEQVLCHYTGYNIWALAGLQAIISILELLNKQKLKKLVERLYEDYYRNFYKLAKFAVERKGYLPPCIDFPFGIDWGNLLLLYPTQVFNKNDEIVEKTLNHFRERMREWISTYGKLIHGYISERVGQAYIVRGDQLKALEIFYGMLLHTGSVNDGFEFYPSPWGSRDYKLVILGIDVFYNFPPHGWFAANFNNLLRNMLIREENNVLHVFSVLSPSWIKPGDMIYIKNAPTYFGKVSILAKVGRNTLEISIRSSWENKKPDKIVIHIPYFMEVVSVTSGELYKNTILIRPQSEDLSITITYKLPIKSKISYRLFINAYKKRYRLSYNLSRKIL